MSVRILEEFLVERIQEGLFLEYERILLVQKSRNGISIGCFFFLDGESSFDLTEVSLISAIAACIPI